MPQPAGHRMALSLPRRIICDIMHFAKRVPTIPVQRRMNLAALADARDAATPRPGWAALFVKAYGLVAAARPELRRSYMSFPWPHLYQHAASTASIAFERPWSDGDSAVFFAHLLDPEKRTLVDIDQKFLRYKTQPFHMIAPVRRILRVARLPGPVRRLLWWIALNLSGEKRAHFFGTYGVSTYGGLGAASLHPLTVLTTTLNFGVVEPDGSVDVRLVYDHRVLDGATVARALGDLEEALHGPILSELKELHDPDRARALDPISPPLERHTSRL